MSPFGLGGLPAPSFQPRLKGRNHDALPFRCVQKRTSCSSTAKWATQRPNAKSFSRGLRSRRYCQTASLTVCLVRAVLQLEGEDRQAVDEEPDVERAPGLVAAVAKLAGDTEAVLLEAFPRRLVAGRGRAVEESQVMRPVPDAAAQHVDGAAPGDLSLQPGEELAPGGAILGERQRFGGLGPGRTQEGRELGEVDAVLAVVVVGVPAAPADAAIAGGRLRHRTGRGRVAGAAGQRGADEPFEAAFAGVGGHRGAAAVAVQPFSVSVSAASPICRGEKRFLRSFHP